MFWPPIGLRGSRMGQYDTINEELVEGDYFDSCYFDPIDPSIGIL
jgi:hypothetical protein